MPPNRATLVPVQLLRTEPTHPNNLTLSAIPTLPVMPTNLACYAYSFVA